MSRPSAAVRVGGIEGQPPSQPPSQQPPQPGGAPEVPPGEYQGQQMPPGGWQYPVAPVKPPWAGPPLAGWGSRAGAVLLDAVVLIALAIVIYLPSVVAFIAGSTTAGIILVILASLAYLVAAFVYAPYFM